MHLKICHFLFLLLLFISNSASGQKKVFPLVTSNGKVTILYDAKSFKLDSILAHVLAEDIERITTVKPAVTTEFSKAKGNIVVIGNIQSELIQKFIDAQSGVHKSLVNKWECFALKVIDKPLGAISKALVIAGSDSRGTAFGVFTLSEKLGVSPWYWWADVPVKQQKELVITQEDFVSSSPTVKYRGIFVNDEDWGLQPWAAKTFEPETGDIGPHTYAKAFELLLRLKANMIWPAMHPSTKAFFHYPGNIKVAKDYQIIIGSSHAEPMLRNNVSEWNEKTMGPFNYITNKEKVYKYWEDRVNESKNINTIYTIGMRGVHDSKMEGVNNSSEAVPLLEQIFEDQRQLLSKYANKDVTAIPQVFIAYKEVLDIYDSGLKVPDDVTLVWPDDNYGYIQRLNNEKEEKREGGAGVYYHASYWGRPHDYLWLPSTHPSLMREEMMKAYETGATRLWVLNVGDIKPQEYNIQEFLDMAYDPIPFKDSRYPKQHLLRWVTKIFGEQRAQKIQCVLWEYYQLAFERKPEFMGWSQTEPNTKTTYTEYNHFYFGDEAQKRIDRYTSLEKTVKELRRKISSKQADAFYQLVYYPVTGASQINKKFLYRDKAFFYSKQNRLSAFDYAEKSKQAYDSIVSATYYYNTQLSNGKWEGIMSMKPRNLSVYQEPDIPELTIDTTNSWSIAPEGFVHKDSSLLSNSDPMTLPSFDNISNQRYFVDIFLSKNQRLNWKASASDAWIHLSQKDGELHPGWEGSQTRILVTVNWAKIPENKKKVGEIIFSAGEKVIRLKVTADKKDIPLPSGFNNFVSNNGFVSMQAVHFTRQVHKGQWQWESVDGLGYFGKSLQSLPISVQVVPFVNEDSIRKNNSFVEYEFYCASTATPVVHVFTLPTYPINDKFSVRYAVSIDDGPLKVVDTRTYGRSEEWKQNVLKNRAERGIEMPLIHSGKHSLRIFLVDPGVVLDEIRIDLGGLKKAYSFIPETKLKLP